MREKVWLKAYIAYTRRNYGIPNNDDAERWAKRALEAFDKQFKK